jgi:hypothetical protein
MVVCVVACGAPAGMNPIEGGPVDSGKGSLTAARTFLEGRWLLESFEVFPAAGPPVTLRGEGTLVYDEFGNLRMEIRADEKSSDVLRAAGIEIVDNRISTDGRTVIDLQNRTIAYIAEGKGFATSASGPLALNRPRHWDVTDDTLTLTTRDDNGKPMSIGRWRRMR